MTWSKFREDLSSMIPPPPKDFEEYLTPHEAAEQLERLSDELGQYGVAPQDIEELRLIGRRFHRHLGSRESLHDLLRDVAERILC
jgi:hypothetical protein